MGETTKIEWTDATFNPWIGCTNVSPACDHCYAEAWAKRSGLVEWGNHPRRLTSPATWNVPRKLEAGWHAFARKHGRKRRVFCASLADVFDNQVPEEWRADLWALIRECRHLNWLLLTKRPQNIRKMLPENWGPNGWAHVWLGTTAENQHWYNRRWFHLAKVPAVVRFISYEPALGPLDCLRLNDSVTPDWVIDGGESGGNARFKDPNWSRGMRDACIEEGIAYFLKQHGTYKSNPLYVEQGKTLREAAELDPNGKGGQLLDGKLWHEFPA
jgi:protein gp37